MNNWFFAALLLLTGVATAKTEIGFDISLPYLTNQSSIVTPSLYISHNTVLPLYARILFGKSSNNKEQTFTTISTMTDKIKTSNTFHGLEFGTLAQLHPSWSLHYGLQYSHSSGIDSEKLIGGFIFESPFRSGSVSTTKAYALVLHASVNIFKNVDFTTQAFLYARASSKLKNQYGLGNNSVTKFTDSMYLSSIAPLCGLRYKYKLNY